MYNENYKAFIVDLGIMLGAFGIILAIITLVLVIS